MPEAIETEKGTRAGRPLLLHVWVRTLEPVAGRIALDGRRAAAFEGWLDLLQRLSELMASAPRSVADRTDLGSGIRRFIRDDRKEET